MEHKVYEAETNKNVAELDENGNPVYLNNIDGELPQIEDDIPTENIPIVVFPE